MYRFGWKYLTLLEIKELTQGKVQFVNMYLQTIMTE